MRSAEQIGEAMKDKLAELKVRLTEIRDVRGAESVLAWDQFTYMPPGGAEARGRQSATLSKLAHEKLVDPAIGNLLDELRAYEDDLPAADDDAALIRVARREYERATKIPSGFMAEFAQHSAAAYAAWTKARPANDFSLVQDSLAKTLDYSRKAAEFFPGYDHIADPLIDFADYGMKAESIRTIFGALREQLVPIAKAITSQPPAEDGFLHRHFPEQAQWDFGLDVINRFGYDMERGRQDKTPHPFTINFSIGDVRITTRVKEDDLTEMLFGTMHEAGHGMYEQGINPDYEATPLASGTSSGVHESQSRLWENVVGRSRPFWSHFYPKLQQVFPAQLDDVSLGAFYRAINKVEPSLIRTDADEVTYNLHVMIRFDLELALLDGSIEIADLPEAWNARYESDLGIAPPTDSDGVLQDVHWYGGMIGGSFQGYTLGNILGAQFYGAALRAHPEIVSEMGEGEFGTLHTWLKSNIYAPGSKYTPNELVRRVTGGDLSIDPYIVYLRKKYGELYDLS
jgi:carboxypeptidase Taq